MELFTERLILRDYEASDWEAVFAYRSNPRYLRYYPWEAQNPAEVQSFIKSCIDWQGERPRYRYQFAITLKDDGKLIGGCGIRKDAPDAMHGELGYELAPGWWGNGYASEAARAMLRFGFERQQLHRIQAFSIAENAASLRMLEKIGMRREGCLRENVWMKGRWWDTFVFGMLVYEWQASIDKGLSF